MKECMKCGNNFERPAGISATQWQARKLCSRECEGKQPDGMSRLEVAKKLGISVTRVKRIEERALRKLAIAARRSAAIRELMCLAS